ncbi:MAG: lamin tail domain-containing protein, partial [Candidatus Thermoplasmatota archaeon]|nr:lamin tail domain-containing protein [Candidatus Thermoplasmatota archaeon]
MSPRFFVVALLVAMFLGQSTGTVLTYDHGTVNAANGRNVNVKISEILVSASSESYNGTDWNNDGDIGSSSDQFIELWNAGSEPVDVSDWLLDDVTDGGSAPCRLAWNTTIQPNDYIVIFRASSRIEFDYWDGDTATISDAAGNLVDTLSYPAEDSWWDFSYVKAANGTVSKVKPPTPGWGEG